MVDLQGQIIPTSEEEYDLLQGLYEVTGEAQRAGIPTEEIVASLTFVAASIMVYGDEDPPEPPERPADTRRETCPNCGETIETVNPYVGGDVEIEPCGCFVTTDAVPGWIDDG